MGRITQSYFQTEVTGTKKYSMSILDAKKTADKIKKIGVPFSLRSLHRMKLNETKDFTIKQTKISITKIKQS